MRYVSLEDLRKAITEGRRKGKEQGLAYFIEEILVRKVSGNATAMESGNGEQSFAF
jgi:hypothetical protein